MAILVNAEEQLTTFIAESMPEKILHFKFDLLIQERIKELVEKKKDNVINSTESLELDKYLLMDLLIGMAKARASKNLLSL